MTHHPEEVFDAPSATTADDTEPLRRAAAAVPAQAARLRREAGELAAEAAALRHALTEWAERRRRAQDSRPAASRRRRGSGGRPLRRLSVNHPVVGQDLQHGAAELRAILV